MSRDERNDRLLERYRNSLRERDRRDEQKETFLDKLGILPIHARRFASLNYVILRIPRVPRGTARLLILIARSFSADRSGIRRGEDRELLKGRRRSRVNDRRSFNSPSTLLSPLSPTSAIKLLLGEPFSWCRLICSSTVLTDQTGEITAYRLSKHELFSALQFAWNAFLLSRHGTRRFVVRVQHPKIISPESLWQRTG